MSDIGRDSVGGIDGGDGFDALTTEPDIATDTVAPEATLDWGEPEVLPVADSSDGVMDWRETESDLTEAKLDWGEVSPAESVTIEAAEAAEAEAAEAAEAEVVEAKAAEAEAARAEAAEAEVAEAEATEVAETEAKVEAEKAQAAEAEEEHLRFGELAPNTTFERNGYTYTTDEYGRVVTAHGRVHLEEGIRDNKESARVGHLGVKDDEGGHLFGARFGGTGEGVNIVPQNMNLNRGDWKRMENDWAELCQDGQEPDVTIDVVYDDNSPRPMGFGVIYEKDDVQTTRTFLNEQNGEFTELEE